MLPCTITVEQINESFMKAPPAFAATIKDKSLTHPSFNADLPEYRIFDLGQGTTLTEMIHRGELPEYETDLSRWKKIESEGNCLPSCGYNWSPLGGNSFDTKTMTMMDRDFRTQTYCVKNIQTTLQYEQMFEQIVKNISRQIDFHKEFNVAQNVLNMLSKKFVVDSEGIKTNQADPYTYPAVGTTKLSAMNIYILTRIYSYMRKMIDVEPFDVQNGKPIFAMQSSDDLLADMFRDDPLLREDIRRSSKYSNDLVDKYNIVTTIRSMFFHVSTDYAPRYKIVSGAIKRISPFVNGVPAEVGSYSANNPEYEAAPYEGAVFHGKNPFALYNMPTASTIGGGTDFGPEVSWFDNMEWINLKTEEDPFRRSGFFATHATLGVAPQNSEGIFEVLFPRSIGALFSNPRQPVAVAADPGEITNKIPTQSCPCPQVKSITPNPITAGRYFFEFWTPITGSIDSNVTFGLTTGGYKVGVLKALAANNLTADIDLGSTFAYSDCMQFTSIYCANTLECNSYVLGGSQCRSEETGAFDLFLEAPIYADTVGDEVVAYFANGSSTHLQVVSFDMTQSKWRFKYYTGYGPTDNPTGVLLGNYGGNQAYLGNGNDAIPLAGDFFCDRGIPVRICVPTATEATCPACAAKGPTITQCS